MATERKKAEVTLGIAKSHDARKPATATLTVEIEADSYIVIDLDADQFLKLTGGSVIATEANITRGSW